MTSQFVLLTWPGALFAILSGGAQALAYWWCHERDVSPVERRAIGVLIIGMCFTIGWLLDDRASPVVAFWHTVGWSGFVTALCYRFWPRKTTAPVSDTPEADALMDRLGRELGEK